MPGPSSASTRSCPAWSSGNWLRTATRRTRGRWRQRVRWCQKPGTPPRVRGVRQTSRRSSGQAWEGRRDMAETKDQAAEAQQSFFRITDNIPEEAWYWAALGSIGISAVLKLAEKDDWAIFVGQWPPTFLLFGLYHRLI